MQPQAGRVQERTGLYCYGSAIKCNPDFLDASAAAYGRWRERMSFGTISPRHT